MLKCRPKSGPIAPGQNVINRAIHLHADPGQSGERLDRLRQCSGEFDMLAGKLPVKREPDQTRILSRTRCAGEQLDHQSKQYEAMEQPHTNSIPPINARLRW
jgi:hypothetical protein